MSGHFGGSILGRHLEFTPRVSETIALHNRYTLHAGIDVSDGLSLDLNRLATSSGCGALIDLTTIPIADSAFQLASQPGDESALEHALGDGEDFELILAVPPEEATAMLAEQPLGIPLTRIGEFVGELGLWQHGDTDARIPLTPRGYKH